MKTIDAFQLKLIAITAMLINHIGYVFKDVYASPIWDFTYLAIGLLTFPIMAYTLVQGFHYTRNRWKYAGRLAIFWGLSVIPFHYAFQAESPFNPVNNIMFTLMMGIFLMVACERIKSPIGQGVLLILFSGLTSLSDWPIIGVVIIYGFYKVYGKPQGQKWVILAATLTMMTAFALKIPDKQLLTGAPIVDITSRLGMLGVIPLINHYNGKRGYNPTWVKWGFYAFYPLHLIILWGLRELLVTG